MNRIVDFEEMDLRAELGDDGRIRRVLDQRGNEMGFVTSDINPSTGGMEFIVDGEDALTPALVQRGIAVSDDVSKSILPADYYDATLLAADSTFLYGRSIANTKQLVTYPVSGLADESAVVNRYLFSTAGASGIFYVMTTRTPGLLFAAVADATALNSANIWRSTDYGATFTKVLELGAGYYGNEGARIDNVTLLSDRSFLDATLADGSQAMFIGEYNVASGRVNGSTNDRLCLWRSNDRGATWLRAATWNDDGASHQIRHFHAVLQNPVTKDVLIACGDSDTECGIIPWDGISALASNTAPAGYAGAKTGAQRYRCCDIVFDGAYGYLLTDADANESFPADIGLWRFNAADLSGWTRIDAKAISECSGRWGFLGLRLTTGEILFTEGQSEASLTGEYHISVYMMNAARSSLSRVGVLRTVNTAALKYAGSLFESGGRVFYTVRGANMHQTKLGTPAFTINSTPFSGVADVVHPAYWIDPDAGTDDDSTGRGKSPRLPYKTLAYAVQGGRLPFGGVVVCDWAGEKQETGSGTATFGASSLDTTQPVDVKGRSRTGTILAQSAASAGAGHLYVGSSVFNMRFRDVWWKTYRASSAQNLLRNSAATSASKFSAINACIGNVTGAEYDSTKGSQITQVPLLSTPGAGGSMTISLIGSALMAPRVALDPIIQGGSAAPSYISAKNCVFFGGGHQVLHDAASSTYVESDCVHYGYGASGIRVGSAATIAPASLRAAFSAGNRGTDLPQIVDETAGDITAAVANIKSAKTSDPLAVTGAAAAAVFDSVCEHVPGLSPRNPLALDFTIHT